MTIKTWQERMHPLPYKGYDVPAHISQFSAMQAEIDALRSELEKQTKSADHWMSEAHHFHSELVKLEQQEPAWFACDTEDADFDVTFCGDREEAMSAIQGTLEDNPALKFEDLVTPLFLAAGASK